MQKKKKKKKSLAIFFVIAVTSVYTANAKPLKYPQVCWQAPAWPIISAAVVECCEKGYKKHEGGAAGGGQTVSVGRISWYNAAYAITRG